MDCHRCQNLRYDGSPYGRCIHRGHRDVVFSREDARKRAKEGVRVYNKQICPDFKLKRRCANCSHWKRGEYFADGITPARKGECLFGIVGRSGDDCPMWEQSKKTSWRKNRNKETNKENEK